MSNSTDSAETFLRGPHSDEHIPASVEEPLTWLDDLGLGERLDAAVESVREFYRAEYSEIHPAETIRRALLDWLAGSVTDLLDNAGAGRLNLGAGSRHFYAALERLSPKVPGDGPASAAPPPRDHGVSGTAAF